MIPLTDQWRSYPGASGPQPAGLEAGPGPVPVQTDLGQMLTDGLVFQLQGREDDDRGARR